MTLIYIENPKLTTPHCTSHHTTGCRGLGTKIGIYPLVNISQHLNSTPIFHAMGYMVFPVYLLYGNSHLTGYQYTHISVGENMEKVREKSLLKSK